MRLTEGPLGKPPIQGKEEKRLVVLGRDAPPVGERLGLRWIQEF